MQGQELNFFTAAQIYSKGRIDIQKVIKKLTSGTLVSPKFLMEMINDCKKITVNEPNVVDVEDPVTIIGDIHGQLYDLLKILEITGLDKPNPKSKIIFLGDYVDRGLQSLEVTILLLCLKLLHPKSLFLLRGNHQSRQMTEQYNFRGECLDVYNSQVYDLFMQLFDSFPLASVVNKAYFCVHGGISDKDATLGKINSIQRFCQVPLGNVLHCDLIWADPCQDQRGKLRNRVVYNFARDCSENNLKCVIRAHEVFLEGYKLHNWIKGAIIPPVITVFSAPNYCGTYNNKGAIMKIQKNQMKIKQIRQHEPERHRCLNFDVFSWTIDEILKNVNEVMKYLTKSFSKKYFSEMSNSIIYDQGIVYCKYALESKKAHLIAKIKSNEPSIIKVKMTEEEQRNYLFNRSIDYYGETEKAHYKSSRK